MSVKRYEWMACDEHSCHCDVVESAEGDMVDYEDYAALEQKLAESQREFRAADATIENLQMQVEKLAAENALLKKSEPAPFSKLMMEALDVYQAGADEVPELAMLSAYTKLRDGLKTPATDAFLAEVRASGVDVARNAMIDFVEGEVGPNENVPGLIRSAEICVSIADELRKGVQS